MLYKAYTSFDIRSIWLLYILYGLLIEICLRFSCMCITRLFYQTWVPFSECFPMLQVCNEDYCSSNLVLTVILLIFFVRYWNLSWLIRLYSFTVNNFLYSDQQRYLNLAYKFSIHRTLAYSYILTMQEKLLFVFIFEA